MSEHAPVEQPESKPRVTTRRAIVAALVLIPIGIVLAFSLYLADTAGELPWQTDPTRIPVTPSPTSRRPFPRRPPQSQGHDQLIAPAWPPATTRGLEDLCLVSPGVHAQGGVMARNDLCRPHPRDGLRAIADRANPFGAAPCGRGPRGELEPREDPGNAPRFLG
jgi:hypothetical protein